MASYGSAAGVEALVPSVGTLGAGSKPTLVQVTAWLAEGYALINRAIASAGYGVPLLNTAAVYDELSSLNNLYTAAYALRSLAIDTASGESEERSEVWLKDFYARLKSLAASDLTLVGATLLPSTTTTRRRRIRTLQMRKVDGYSRGSTDETYEVQHGEYTGATAPSE